MTLLAALTEVFDDLPTIKTLLHADQYETNMLTDKFLTSEYPLMVVAPFTVVESHGKSGVLKGTVDLTIYLINRNTAITTDYSTTDIETDFIEPLRLLARKFLHKLNEHSIIDPESTGIGSMTINPEYGLYDAHTFGVSIRVTVPIMEHPAVC